ncbi:MAG: hypothetical protein GY769_06340 [bacterium]|nr:hypothetical protein [bacterium]
MKPLRPFHLTLRTALVAVLGAAVLFSVGCPRAEEASSAEQAALAAAVEAESQALQERLEEAAAAQAAANEAAEKVLAEREALLEIREEQLRMEEALRLEKARDARRKTELAERERLLAAREKQLENYESNLAFQERELRDREAILEDAAAATSGATDPEGLDEADPYVPGASEPEVADAMAAEPEFVLASLEPGRLLEIEFEETVSSATHREGDSFSGRLVQDLTAEDGTLVVPAGTEVLGRVTSVTPLKKVGGRASIEVEFTHLVLSPTESIAISASFVELGVDKRKDKKKIAGAAIVGAILGRVLGGDGAESVLAGAAAGAAAGTVAVARAQGKDAELPAGQIVALQLEEVVTVEVQMTGPVER